MLEQRSRLAPEGGADRLERREADRLGLAGLEDREVGEGDVDARGELAQRHAALVQDFVQSHQDRHVTPSLRALPAAARPGRTRPRARTAEAPRATARS